MRTVKWNPFLSGVCVFVGGMLLLVGTTRADVSTTNPAAIVVFPKLRVETTDPFRKIDTIVQLTNTADNPVNVRCFYVNANGHCSNDPTAICDPRGTPADTVTSCHTLFAACLPGWQETDFSFTLPAKQPIFWTVRQGLPTLPLDFNLPPGSVTKQFNTGSIPPASEDPFIGELKCIEVGDDELPIDSNDLKGEATIEEIDRGLTPPGAAVDGGNSHSGIGLGVTLDSRSYNAIGIQAIPGANDRDNVLVLGVEYNACPNILVLDHFFDDAFEPATEHRVTTDITFVPCSEDFEFQFPITTTVQFLVFNEFEQRFSTSRPVRCLAELQLSDIDTRPGTKDNFASIFNIAVEGTLTGQTLARGVSDGSTTHGNGLLAVAEEFHTGTLIGSRTTSAAFAVHQRGTRQSPDTILLPPASPSEPPPP